jgi:pentatricopeptide repeat protein
MCDKVEEVYNEAKTNKTLNINAYTTFIKALAKKCDLLRIISVYKELKNKEDCKLDCATYNVFLDACAKCENYKKMLEFFEDMKGTELLNTEYIIPDITTYIILIKAMSKIGNMEKALSLYKEMKNLDYRSLEYAQEDSRICEQFVKINPLRPYSFQVWQKYISRISASSLERLMVELNKIAINVGLEDINNIRQDSTVIETNIHHPTNNSLVWD